MSHESSNFLGSKSIIFAFFFLSLFVVSPSSASSILKMDKTSLLEFSEYLFICTGELTVTYVKCRDLFYIDLSIIFVI
jgi:hypothetical protein